MRNIILPILFAALISLPAYAGYPAASKNLLPDISPITASRKAGAPDVQTPATQIPATTPADAAQAVVPQPPDRCAGYAGSPRNYMICKDQLKKIQRLIDARNERTKAPAPKLSPQQMPPRYRTPVSPAATAPSNAPAEPSDAPAR